MCIICNATDERGAERASEFLAEFARAREAMADAASALLAFSQSGLTVDDRKRYDGIHKQMVRISREWNALEEKREAGHP